MVERKKLVTLPCNQNFKITTITAMYSRDLDEHLVKKTISVSGKKARRDTALAALHDDFIRVHNRREILDYQGKGIWEGDLDEMRDAR
jgi:hypothetical protein